MLARYVLGPLVLLQSRQFSDLGNDRQHFVIMSTLASQDALLALLAVARKDERTQCLEEQLADAKVDKFDIPTADD